MERTPGQQSDIGFVRYVRVVGDFDLLLPVKVPGTVVCCSLCQKFGKSFCDGAAKDGKALDIRQSLSDKWCQILS